MDKQKEKTLVAEAEKFLQQLVDNSELNQSKLQILIKKLQKVNSPNNKKIEEDKKDLSDYLQDKIQIKEFLEKDEANYLILAKAAQKISSKLRPKQENAEQNSQTKTPASLFKFEKKDLICIFNNEGENYFKNNSENLLVYFENLTSNKIEQNSIPIFTMIFLPNDKKIFFYLKCKEKMNLSFSQVDYLCNSGKDIFLNIDYYKFLENCQIDKSREYKENCIDMAHLEKIIKELPLFKEYEMKIEYIDDDYQKLKKSFKEYFNSIKDKIKNVVTNNKEFFNELVI
jgi:hypothetical protein